MIRRRRSQTNTHGGSADSGELLHVDGVPYDEEAIERELAQSDGEVAPLRATLRTLLEPENGLEQRTYDAVQQSLLDRETMLTAASLFNLGWRTPKIILMDSESPDGR